MLNTMLNALGYQKKNTFVSPEHRELGRHIIFPEEYFEPKREGQGSEKLLRLPNGLKLSFSQIVALAGDFYGIPGQPIVHPSEPESEKKSGCRKRFTAAYDTLGRVPSDEIKKEVDQILKIMDMEEKAVKEGGAGERAQEPSEVYKELDDKMTEKWDTLTGGKWAIGVPWVSGRIMKLAEDNSDHFLPYAKDAYLTGHELALDSARRAGRGQDKTLLEEALSIDAFACHFLTDSFSSGHIRVPRVELGKHVTPAKVGHYLSKFMHDEDNNHGLRVTNGKGDKWIAYGDGMLLNKVAKDTYRLAIQAVQTSVDEICQAFEAPDEDPNSSMADLIPFIDPSEKNNHPLFQMKEGILHRRADMDDLGDSTTTTDWIGATTAISLRSYKPQNTCIEDTTEQLPCRRCGHFPNVELALENDV